MSNQAVPGTENTTRPAARGLRQRKPILRGQLSCTGRATTQDRRRDPIPPTARDECPQSSLHRSARRCRRREAWGSRSRAAARRRVDRRRRLRALREELVAGADACVHIDRPSVPSDQHRACLRSSRTYEGVVDRSPAYPADRGRCESRTKPVIREMQERVVKPPGDELGGNAERRPMRRRKARYACEVTPASRRAVRGDRRPRRVASHR